MQLSNFVHKPQRHESDCLVACAEMTLAYLQIPTSYEQLGRLLQARPFGTPFGNIKNIEALGLHVTINYNGDAALIEHCIGLGLPVLVNVQTADWPHWQGESTYHAVLVVGIDHQHSMIYIHDPYFTEVPISLPLNQFLIGWEEQNRQFAVISLAPL